MYIEIYTYLLDIAVYKLILSESGMKSGVIVQTSEKRFLFCRSISTRASSSVCIGRMQGADHTVKRLTDIFETKFPETALEWIKAIVYTCVYMYVCMCVCVYENM